MCLTFGATQVEELPAACYTVLDMTRRLVPFLREGSILILDDLVHFPGGVDAATANLDAPRENWNAFFEALQRPNWIWKLEVLAAPWHLPFGEGNIMAGSRGVAFRLVA